MKTKTRKIEPKIGLRASILPRIAPLSQDPIPRLVGVFTLILLF